MMGALLRGLDETFSNGTNRICSFDDDGFTLLPILFFSFFFSWKKKSWAIFIFLLISFVAYCTADYFFFISL